MTDGSFTNSNVVRISSRPGRPFGIRTCGGVVSNA
jgi:hypothetical protein